MDTGGGHAIDVTTLSVPYVPRYMAWRMIPRDLRQSIRTYLSFIWECNEQVGETEIGVTRDACSERRGAFGRTESGVAQGSPLGLEIDVSTSGSLSYTLRRSKKRKDCIRHLWTLRRVF